MNIQLPAQLKHVQVSQWAAVLEKSIPAHQICSIDASELKEFDSSALALLLHASRLAQLRQTRLNMVKIPEKLHQLARVYGVADCLTSI
jgi:phospholipid transport system transporter-binding protein